MTTGLTLGKFAPLHAGHQLLIETALAETDHVIVLAYDAPETTPVPLPVRADWIRRLYPGVEVVEAWDGPTIVGDTPEVMRMHEEYILTLLAGRPITHFYSSEFYGDHVSRALGALDRRIDPARVRLPVSGTTVRSNPFAMRQYLHPAVYWDLVVKAVFLGAPSTGKTTLARRLAAMYETAWVPEYGREYWEQHQVERRLTQEQLVEIAEGHREREERAVIDANQYLFVDTDASTTLLFSQYYHGTAHARMHQLAAAAASRYNLFFLCEDDIPYDDTWDRSGDVQRAAFQQQIRIGLLARNVPFTSLRGSLDERIAVVADVLARYRLYG